VTRRRRNSASRAPEAREPVGALPGGGRLPQIVATGKLPPRMRFRYRTVDHLTTDIGRAYRRSSFGPAGAGARGPSVDLTSAPRRWKGLHAFPELDDDAPCGFGGFDSGPESARHTVFCATVGEAGGRVRSQAQTSCLSGRAMKKERGVAARSPV